MADNGKPDRFERLEASHVRLMTDLELFSKAQDKAWKQHRRRMKDFDRRLRENEADHKRMREEADQRNTELRDRIAELTSGMGAFIREFSERLERFEQKSK